MSNSTVAKRYAQALFELAQQQQILAEVGADLAELKAVIHNSPELLTLLAVPKLSSERKKQLVAEVFANVHPVVLNTLYVLIDKKRIADISSLVDAYVVLAASAQGIAEATVFSTRELTDEERTSISTSFAQLVGKQALNITNVIDPSLLGGVRIQIGNHIYDSSIVSKLDRLKRELIGS